MAWQITCPSCNSGQLVTEAYSGSRVTCSSCGTILLLHVVAEAQRPAPVQLSPRDVPTAYVSGERARGEALALLAQWLDVDRTQIAAALAMLEAGKAYESWRIPKGNSGEFRTISSPDPALKEVQRRVLDRLLYRLPVSNAAHGFVPGRSIVTNARHHLDGARCIYNLDLKDAFPSVKADRVKHLFVRYLKMPMKHLGPQVSHEIIEEAVDMLVRLVTDQGQLPQGGPTSGYLLNLGCLKLDKYVFKLLGRYGPAYRYTRYADDITVSSTQSDIPDEIKHGLHKIIRHCGYEINRHKVSYASRDRNQRLEVTGLVLEKGQIRIPRKRLDTYRATIHQAYLAAPDQLGDEKRLEVQSIVSFVWMVYNHLPAKIYGPYKKYADKHLAGFPGRRKPAFLELYPEKGRGEGLPVPPAPTEM